MAKLTIEIEDLADGGLHVSVVGSGLATTDTMAANTAAQNAAILLIGTMRKVGLGGDDLPDLGGQARQRGKRGRLR